MASRLRGSRPYLTSVCDNVLASLGNFCLVFLTARAGTEQEVGSLALALGAYSLALTLSRNISGTMLLFAPRMRHGWAVLYWAWGQGLILALVLLPAALIDWPGRIYFAILAAGAPFLLALDAARYVGMKERRPQIALALDAMWTGTQLAASVLILVQHRPPEALAMVWAGGAVAASLPLLVAKLRGHLPGVRALVAGNASLIKSLGLEGLVIAGGSQLATVLMAALLSIGELGVIRVAYTVLGPLTLVQAAVSPLLVAKVSKERSDRSVRWALLVTVSVSAAMLVAAALAARLPHEMVRAILGETGVRAQHLFMLSGASAALSGCIVGMLQMSRVFLSGNRVVSLRSMAVVGDVSAVVVGAAFGSAQSVLLALVIAETGMLALVWVAGMRYVRKEAVAAERVTPGARVESAVAEI